MNQLPPNNQLFLLLGQTLEGNQSVILKETAFAKHKHIIGTSGSGKSSFLAFIALSLLRQSVPCLLIDPHGDLTKLILSLLAESDFFHIPRAYERLWYVDFARSDAAIAFNVLKQGISPHATAAHTLEAIHRAFPSNTTTAALDNIILASVFVLATHGLPLTSLQHFLLDASFRNQLVEQVTDSLVADFLREKLNSNSSSLVDSTLRRSFLLTFSPVLRATLGQMENKLNFSDLIDSKKTSCLFNLGGLDEHTKRLLGCLLLVSIEQAFLARAALPPEKRTPCHVIIDEFPLFSASEESFAVVLEQVRKYGGTLYLAHQTTSQLSKGIAGSLQNALSIVMKLGYEDSSWAAQRFVRSENASPSDSLSDLLWGTPRRSSSPFEGMTTQQAKQRFESLRRQEAIVTMGMRAYHIKTPTLPQATCDARTLERIEATYATRLLTPISHTTDSTDTNISVPVAIVRRDALADTVATGTLARRRAPVPKGDEREPFRLGTGVLETDILLALAHFHYLTLAQVAKLLQKERSSNYLRTKLKACSDRGLVEPMLLARSSAGKPPTVYTLTQKGRHELSQEHSVPQTPATGSKKHGFLEHTLAVNDILLQAFLLPSCEPSITLLDLKHERTLKQTPVLVRQGDYLVPDGFVHLRNDTEDFGICFEIDRNTEDRDKIQQKLRTYRAFAQGPYQRTFGLESLTIAFCVTEGGDQRVKQLVSWAQQALANTKDAADLFLFTAVDPAHSDPCRLFLDRLFVSPFENVSHALVEIV